MASALDYMDPAQAHGMLCGMLCADPTLDSQPWLAQLRSETMAENLLSREILLELFAATVSQLDDETLGFTLLLPDDGTDLSRRADALGHWCQGFISGLGAGGLIDDSAMSAEVHEVLVDLDKIARVGFETEDADEEDEVAYAEIVEYVRIAVMLLSQESRSTRIEHPAPPPHLH
jgi:uncharacterized protein YgfB (UPF0149 family)